MLTYAIPIVLSAFLLFLVQPLIGRFILPWFGGTPAVWLCFTDDYSNLLQLILKTPRAE
jgi:hypothetical protein